MTDKRILFVFAHPDDESFSSGATIARYAHETNCRISLLCATRGQAGKAGEPPLCTQEELPAFREKELREAASILGIDRVVVLDYEDKHVSDVPVQELTQKIIDEIEVFQPQVVVAFAPHGISGHPDHKAVTIATQEAIRELAKGDNPVAKFYYCTIPTEHVFPGHQGRTIFSDPLERITTIIEAPAFQDVVAQALLAHRTQHLSVQRVFPGIEKGDYSHVRTTNYFILAWNKIPEYHLQGKEHDFFEGILC